MPRWVIAALLPLVLAGPGWAVQPAKSLYTAFDLSGCRVVKRHPDGNAWQCDGLPGYPIYVAEGDLRTFVSFGPSAGKLRAATQTLSSFNSLHKGGNGRTTVEWRYHKRSGRAVPYAAIIRFDTTSEGRKGEVLVVLKVGEREACHVAHVDALANDDAIMLARAAADGPARSFDCQKEPSVTGASGKSPM